MLLPDLEFCLYYSDGAPLQYKNYKNFANLLYHEKDNDVPAELHFFATSHAKSPCNWIAGTVKHFVFHASWQMYPILNIKKMFDWCQENITGIEFKNIQSQIMELITSFNFRQEVWAISKDSWLKITRQLMVLWKWGWLLQMIYMQP